jgi:hypothetical protein
MKREYTEGPEVREEFERTMKELFRAPKQEIEKRPKPATSRKNDEEQPDKD